MELVLFFIIPLHFRCIFIECVLRKQMKFVKIFISIRYFEIIKSMIEQT